MSYRKYLLTALGTAAGAALLAACSGSTTSPSASSTEATDAGADVSEQSANDVAGQVFDFSSAETEAGASADYMALAAPAATRGAVQVRGAGPGDPGCTGGQVTLDFTYPASDNRDTVAFHRTWEYLSANGCETQFVADSTDSTYFTVADTVFANGLAERWHGHRYDTRAHWLTGDSTGAGTLLSSSAAHVWNGSAVVYDSADFENSAGTVARAHAWQAADTLNNIAFPHPRSGDVYPVSGSWVRWMTDTVTFTGTTSGTADYMWHIVVTFSATAGVGNQDASLQIYNGAGALVKTCEVDLLAAQIVPGSCH